MSELNTELKGLLQDMLGKARAEGIEEGMKKAGEKPVVAQKQEEAPEHKAGFTITRAMRYLAEARGDGRVARDIADRRKDFAVVKAMGESTLAAGGALVEGSFSSEIVPVLNPRSVIRSSGVRTIPLPQGGLTMPYGDTAATASYTTEGADVNESTPTTGELHFVPRTLTVQGVVSDDLLQDSSGRGDAFLRDDLVAAIAYKENAQLIRGTGSPISLRQLAIAQGNNTTSAGTSLANKITDLTNAMKYPENDNVFLEGAGWIMSVTTKYGLMSTLDSNGNKVFWDEMSKGTLLGHPYQATTHVPHTGSDGELYFGAFGHCLLAEVEGLDMSVFPGGAYLDSSGTVRSGLSRRQTVYRLVLRHDFNARFRGKELGLITALSY